MFINVNKTYDFDNLTIDNIEELIEIKLKKEKEKLIAEWVDEGIKLEKGRWGRSVISCLLYTSPSPRDMRRSRMPSSA